MTPPRSDDRLAARLTAVAALGFLLFVPPLIGVFDRGAQMAGVPVIWVYLFVAWAVIIGLVAATVRRTD
jgi:putative effector of murein hydrolase LrgA (UPF0299 family)